MKGIGGGGTLLISFAGKHFKELELYLQCVSSGFAELRGAKLSGLAETHSKTRTVSHNPAPLLPLGHKGLRQGKLTITAKRTQVTLSCCRCELRLEHIWPD